MIFALAACGDKPTDGGAAPKTGSVHLVSIDAEHADSLIAVSPYYAKDTITKDIYGTADDADTVAIAAMVLASDDASEDAVYDFLKTIFDNKDALKDQHGKAAYLDLDFATSVTAVPFHPGAAKFYAENGISVESSGKSGSNDFSNATFVTGGESGTYYAYGSVLAQYVTTNSGMNITAISSGGSKANIEDINAGDAQLGFSQSDVMAYAFGGTNLFTEKVDGYSVVAALYMEQVQIVTLNDDIKTVADLKGKTVSVGAAGSGTTFNAIDALSAYGLSMDDIKPVYQSFGDSVESLKDGKIDAAFIVAGAPTSAVSDLAATK